MRFHPSFPSSRSLSTLAAALGAVAAAGACAADGAPGAATELRGAATYRDAATDHDGASHPPATPAGQRAAIELVVRGTATLPEVDPRCALDPAGQFRAIYAGEATIGPDGAYVAALAEAAARLETPSGCALPRLDGAIVTDVVIRAELEATATTCEAYCAAGARADAEAACGASPGAAACRADAEAEAVAACAAACTTEARVIVAEVSLAASALGEVDDDALRAAALGELRADLVFDRAE